MWWWVLWLGVYMLLFSILRGAGGSVFVWEYKNPSGKKQVLKIAYFGFWVICGDL